MSHRIRVLVVDDSAFARKVLREVLSGASDVDVVGIARDGLEALEKIAELKPDVITLDLVMPNLDGLGVLAHLPSEGAPRVVIVSMSDSTSELAISALEAGALELVHKPTALATDKLYELGAELLAKVRAAAAARLHEPRRAPASRLSFVRSTPHRHDVVVIGTSTGGPQALQQILPAFPADFPLPVLVALHIPEGYTDALSRRLDERCALRVEEAAEGMAVEPGRIIVARGGFHLALRRDLDAVRCTLSPGSQALLYTPSVDVLFESAASLFPGRVLGVVMTGMGDDGRRGARAIRQAGGTMLAESEATAVIYGMPRAVIEAGDASGIVPLHGIVDELVRRA